MNPFIAFAVTLVVIHGVLLTVAGIACMAGALDNKPVTHSSREEQKAFVWRIFGFTSAVAAGITAINYL